MFTRQRCPVLLASPQNMWCCSWKRIFHSWQEFSSHSILFYLSTFAYDCTEQNKEIKTEWCECLTCSQFCFGTTCLSFRFPLFWIWCLPLSYQCLLMFMKSQFKTMNLNENGCCEFLFSSFFGFKLKKKNLWWLIAKFILHFSSTTNHISFLCSIDYFA